MANLSKEIYELIEFAFNKGVVCGLEVRQDDDTTYERFTEVLHYAYEHLADDVVLPKFPDPTTYPWITCTSDIQHVSADKNGDLLSE